MRLDGLKLEGFWRGKVDTSVTEWMDRANSCLMSVLRLSVDKGQVYFELETDLLPILYYH